MFLATASLSFTASGTRTKFDAMIASVSMPPTAIEFIDNQQHRLLFKGIQAAVEEPLVANAFAIVYDDLGPVRIAGDLIAKQLSKVATVANERAANSGDMAALTALVASRNLFRLVDSDTSGSLDSEEILGAPQLLDLIREVGENDKAAVERFMSEADRDGDGTISFVEFAEASAPRLQLACTAGAEADAQVAAALERARWLFDVLDSDSSGSLDRVELRSPQLLDLIRQAGEDDESAVERFLCEADRDSDGTISFVEFANAAASEPRLQLADEALEAALRQARGTVAVKQGRKFGRKAPGERFDEMLEQCVQWEKDLGCSPEDCDLKEDVSGEDGRMLQVLKGSFAGARCQPIADALRVCYLDYSPLRLGGDLIFKLLRRVVAKSTQTP